MSTRALADCDAVAPRADGGNTTTAANRLLGALGSHWTQKPGIYDDLDVPLQAGRPAEMEAQRWAN